MTCLYRAMVAAEDFAVLDSEGQPQQPAGLPPLNALLQAASKVDRKQALWWHRHMKEIDTGLRPGHRVPRPGYDPASTTLAQRYQAKSKELSAADTTSSPEPWRASGWPGSGRTRTRWCCFWTAARARPRSQEDAPMSA
ncbi:hypothetical protein ACFZDG_26985 [Kitasatospora xanthocidica]|uniref:hypothetical protein n=1 Tax=Kitasatospora xanthocidica TaxID=83382 RepID=UPI0036EED54B